MTINTSHANIAGDITNDILNILDITDSLYINDTLDTIDIYYTRGKLIPIAILSLCLPQTCSRSLRAIRRRLRVW